MGATEESSFGGGYGFPVFFLNTGFVSTTGLESVSLRPEKVSKGFSFGGGSVRLFRLCVLPRRTSKMSKDFLSLPNTGKPWKTKRKDPF